jgi:hypothetical protein
VNSISIAEIERLQVEFKVDVGIYSLDKVDGDKEKGSKIAIVSS